jgi:hypothetical protein
MDISGFSIFFIGMLFFIVLHDALTGATSQTTAEYVRNMVFYQLLIVSK